MLLASAAAPLPIASNSRVSALRLLLLTVLGPAVVVVVAAAVAMLVLLGGQPSRLHGGHCLRLVRLRLLVLLALLGPPVLEPDLTFGRRNCFIRTSALQVRFLKFQGYFSILSKTLPQIIIELFGKLLQHIKL